MRIISNIDRFIVVDTTQISSCLVKIDDNKHGIIFVVDHKGVLVGVLTDGDFRRWLTRTKSTDLTTPVSEAMNTQFTYAQVGSSRANLRSQFTNTVDIIPLLDDTMRLVSLAFEKLKGFEIAGKTISESSSAYIIAEIGNNHNGCIKHAKELVNEAVRANADCAKFQMRDMASVYKNQGETHDDSADLGAQYVFNLLSKYQLRTDQLIEMFDYCKSQGITPLCTPWDKKSLDILEDYGMPAYKVSSADFTNIPFLKVLAKTGKPLFCSTGMSTEAEIQQSVYHLKKASAQFILLHCNSTYPAPLKDVNLKYLEQLTRISGGGLVGYSGHDIGIDVSIAAVAMGAKVIEKHFTLDKSMEGNDHKVSLYPEEFSQMVSSIRNIEQAMGNASSRVLSQGEMMNRETLAKSLICNVKIRKGELITRSMIDIKSPGQGLQPNKMEYLIGRVATRDIKKGDYFFQSDIDGNLTQAKNYYFDRPFGIPVRYHDFHELKNLSNLDLVEFHLSAQDMDVTLSDYFDKKEHISLAVHSPELFANDHIINFASPDEEYLAVSRQNLIDVIEITRSLKRYFTKTKRPVIVLNAGGFSDKAFLAKKQRQRLYEQVANELSQIDQSGVEIAIQSMPPFPWHFGGQRYHNIFVDPYEIDAYCTRYNVRICLDISHAMMACNYYGWELKRYIELVGKHTAHLHISDALGESGEGVQMGTGDVDFSMLSETLNAHTFNVPFIPEIWQGHKNNGEGFWQALSYLKRYMSQEPTISKATLKMVGGVM